MQGHRMMILPFLCLAPSPVPPKKKITNKQGFDRKLWEAHPFKDEAAGVVGVRFVLWSSDGEEGYPGNLTVEVRHRDEWMVLAWLFDSLCPLASHPSSPLPRPPTA